MTEDWMDHLAGARMRVDRQFEDRVTESQFTSQQWGLIMTAVEFDITGAGDPDTAEMVARTDDIDAIIPELDRIEREMSRGRDPGDGGILDRLRGMFGSLSAEAGGNDEERKAAARVLVDDYADHLQRYLKDNGRWVEICEMAHAAGAGED